MHPETFENRPTKEIMDDLISLFDRSQNAASINVRRVLRRMGTAPFKALFIEVIAVGKAALVNDATVESNLQHWGRVITVSRTDVWWPIGVACSVVSLMLEEARRRGVRDE